MRCQTFTPELDRGALYDFFNLRYLPGDQTLLKGVTRLPAGHCARYAQGRLSVERWYSPPTPTMQVAAWMTRASCVKG